MAHSDLLLVTKLYIPPASHNLVSRPRLTARMNDGLQCALTLVSAPAGFGKTTLLSEWIHTLAPIPPGPRGGVGAGSPTGRRETGTTIPKGGCALGGFPEGRLRSAVRAAWVSLDSGDNDPARFWAYFIAALETLQPGIGESAMALLQSSPTPPVEIFLTSLINAAAAIPQDFALVLDDYHVIEAQMVHDAVAFLLDHLPPAMHLIIASRADPPLPLPRLRARGQLVELRAADLRFMPDEAAAFLNQVMGLNLTPENIATLESRTEGWIAGLQLAALSMRGREDVSNFLAAFAGSQHYILDYLVEEVLQRQPAEIQTFLLRTSILDRMTGPLCDALLADMSLPPGQETLDYLEHANLFIIPLDDRRQWYRYHHLFGEFLRSRLKQVQPEQVAALHRRAAEWYEQGATSLGDKGLVIDAIRHALEAADFERAASLIEQHARETLMRGETSTLQGWLRALPESMVRARPYLGLARAWSLVVAGQLSTAEPYLQEAIRLAAPADVKIQSEAAALNAFIATLRGDVPRAIEFARQALERLPVDDLFLRGMAALNLGMAYDISEDIAAASQAYTEAQAIGQAASNSLLSLMAKVQLADLKAQQGELHAAGDLYQQAIRLAGGPGKQLPFTGIAYASLGRLLYEWNDLDGAARCLTTCVELGRQWVSADMRLAGSVSLAQVRQAQGDTENAQELSREAEQAMQQGQVVSPATIGVARAYQARLWLRQGAIEAAIRWADEYRARPGDASGYPGYLRHIEGASWARVLMAQGQAESAVSLLESLLRAAESAGQTGYVIELMALQALVFQSMGDPAQAAAMLTQALRLAEPEDYVRTFVDEDEPMRALLKKLEIRDWRLESYVQRLLASFDGPSSRTSNLQPPISNLLSEREREVLRLIADGLSNQEIADRLVVAVSTVKTHINNIYAKLGVRSRTQAAARAREMGLL
jgi:LuxR family maltose regulon positive regulatory protein